MSEWAIVVLHQVSNSSATFESCVEMVGTYWCSSN